MPQGGAILFATIKYPGSRFFMVFDHLCARLFPMLLYEQKGSISCTVFGTNPSLNFRNRYLSLPKMALGGGSGPRARENEHDYG
jgi:hypothetical protein